MPLVGDDLPTVDLLVVDVKPGTIMPIDGGPLFAEFLSPIELGWVWWDDGPDGGDATWFLREDPGAKRLALWIADASTGQAREVLAEAAETYVEPHALLPWPSSVRVVPGGERVVWPSERDGWRHLYLFDTRTGALVLIEHPDVFSVAVSGSGVHDLRRYIAYWGEKYQGLASDADYRRQSNPAWVDRLTGKLLLMHGELDDNVHPANTMALVDALVKAGKDFELVIFPGQAHPCFELPYYHQRIWNFFVRHLLDAEPPPYRMADR